MQSSIQIITTNQPTYSFLQAGCPFCRPPNSVKALKGKISHSMDLLTPSSPADLPTLSLTTNSYWLPWGRVTMPLISPLMPVPQVDIYRMIYNYLWYCNKFVHCQCIVRIGSLIFSIVMYSCVRKGSCWCCFCANAY